MADGDKLKISALPAALTLDNTDVLPVVQGQAGSATTKKTTVETLGSHFAETMQFASELQTQNKTLVGAINELQQGGGGGGSSTLEGLTDVNIDSETLTDGQILKYDATNEEWVNGEGGGGASADHVTLTQAEYDALVQAGTVDPDAFYFISDSALPANFHEYSTSEQIVGSWVDGSPVYEKTLYSAGGVTGNIAIPHNISNLDKVLDFSGSVMDSSPTSSGYSRYSLPRVAVDGYNIGLDVVSDTDVRIAVPNIFGTRLYDWYVTIRYTKSSS